MLHENSEDGTVTKEEAINHSLESLADFEELAGEDLVGWIAQNYPDFYVKEVNMEEPNDLN